jgi:hypothetical protein
MTREDKMREQAALRRMNRESKESAFDAFKPENMYNSDFEIQEGWEESGVMDTIRGTIGENDGW